MGQLEQLGVNMDNKGHFDCARLVFDQYGQLLYNELPGDMNLTISSNNPENTNQTNKLNKPGSTNPNDNKSPQKILITMKSRR